MRTIACLLAVLFVIGVLSLGFITLVASDLQAKKHLPAGPSAGFRME